MSLHPRLRKSLRLPKSDMSFTYRNGRPHFTVGERPTWIGRVSQEAPGVQRSHLGIAFPGMIRQVIKKRHLCDVCQSRQGVLAVPLRFFRLERSQVRENFVQRLLRESRLVRTGAFQHRGDLVEETLM